MSEPSVNRDLAGSYMRSLAWWGPGALLMIAAANMGWLWHVAGWSLGLTWIGGLCLANALHCRRVHCYFAGPFAIATALLVLAVGFHLFSLGKNPWDLILWPFVLGWVVLITVPEWIWGRYRAARVPPSR